MPSENLFDFGRCTSTGRKCDGYTHTSNYRAVVSRPSSSLWSTVPILSGLGDNALYLEFYYHRASLTLASNFDREFWTRIVLQMAHSEPAVRHAVTALGYLVKTQSGSLKDARSVSVMDRTFLVQYNKAVRHLVDGMADSSCSIEVGLVACLLFICIEFLRGDHFSALAHLQSGIKIISEQKRRSLDCLQTKPSSPSFSIAIRERVAGSRMISENLVPMFVRAMGTGLLFGAPFEPLLEKFCPHPQNPQYQPFASFLEAQSAMFELRNATIILISVIFRKLSRGTLPTAEDLQYHAHFLTCHESWLQNLQVLERNEQLTRETRIVASSLKISYHSIYIALVGATDIYQTIFDEYMTEFKALNHHAKIVLDSMDLPNSPRSFTYPVAASSARSLSDNSESPASSPTKPEPTAAHFTFEASLIFPLVRRLEIDAWV